MALFLLPLAFLGVAFLYSMAGFGGGSSYIALLAISGVPVASIPVLALGCNLIVSSQGAVLLYRRRHLHWRWILPLLITSVPAAYLGGSWRLSSETFITLLAVVLTLAGLALAIPAGRTEKPNQEKARPGLLLVLGGILGGLAGLSGIGGGIFLSPALHLLRIDRAKAIAASASVFIAINSLAGLAGQLSKGTGELSAIPAYLYVACPLAVLAGGFFGSRHLVHTLDPLKVRRITAVVVLLVAVRLWLKVATGY